MSAFRGLLADAADERFRTALLLGVASIPFTVGVNSLSSPDSIEATPLFIACVIAGYLYGSRVESSVRAGTLVGLVGGVPIFIRWITTTVVEVWGYPPVTDFVGDSIGMAAVVVLSVLLSVLVGTVILLFIGWIGGAIGGWASRRLGSSGPAPSQS